MTRKTQTAGEMKKSKNQIGRKTVSNASSAPSEPTDAILTRQQAAQQTHQTRSKNKTNKFTNKAELCRKSRDRKKKKVVPNFKKEKSKGVSLNITHQNKSNAVGSSSSRNQSLSPRKVEQRSTKSNTSPEKAGSVKKPDAGSKSSLDRSKIISEKELKTARRQIKKQTCGTDRPNQCNRKGLDGSEDTEKSKDLIENHGRCPGFDRFGRPITDIPDVVIVKEELADLDEDDIMDIVLCPSPVWWEEPVDEELKTMFKKEGEKCSNPEQQNRSKTGSSVNSNKKKSFALETILDNIRLKNTNVEKKNGISDQRNDIGAAIILKSAALNQDTKNTIQEVTRSVPENTSGSVSGENLKVSENLIGTEVETEKAISDLRTTESTSSPSETSEHKRTTFEDGTDEEVAQITEFSEKPFDIQMEKNSDIRIEKSKFARDSKKTNVKDAEAHVDRIVDLTLDDDEDDMEITNPDPNISESENRNLDLKLLKSPSEIEYQTFESISQMANEPTITKINNSYPDKTNYLSELTGASIEDSSRINEHKDVDEDHFLKRQKGPDFSAKFLSSDLHTKENGPNEENDVQELSIQDIRRVITEEEEESISKIAGVEGKDDIETDSKELISKIVSVIEVPIEINIEVCLEKENDGKLTNKEDKAGEEKSAMEERNEVAHMFIEKHPITTDEGLIIKTENVVTNIIKQENSIEIESDCSKELQKNIDEIEILTQNIVEIPIRNKQNPEKRDDERKLDTNLSRKNMVIKTALNNLDTTKYSEAHISKTKSTQKTSVTGTQEKSCVKELTEIKKKSAIRNPIKVPSSLSASTENEKPNVSVETEQYTEKEDAVCLETNVDKSEDKAKRIREEMKVIEEGLRMAQQIQKLSKSHIDSSKRNKLLELSSELLETLRNSMHDFKGTEDVSEMPSLPENDTAGELGNNCREETILRKCSEDTGNNISVDIELQNHRNQRVSKQNTEDIAVCTMVSDNSKKQVKERNFMARSQKIRNTYLDMVDYESNFKKHKITPARQYSNSENTFRNEVSDEWKQLISVSTSKNYSPLAELSTKDLSNSETHVIAPDSRKLILKDFRFPTIKLQKLSVNCESLKTSSEMSVNDPICGATPVSTSPKKDFQKNDSKSLPADTNKICDADNSSKFCCSRSIAEIPQESAKRLPLTSEMNFTKIVHANKRASSSVRMDLGKSLKKIVIGKPSNCSSNFKRKNTSVPKRLKDIHSGISTHGKSDVRKCKKMQIPKNINVRMKSPSTLYMNSTELLEDGDKSEKKILENSTPNDVSVNLEDKPSRANNLESDASHIVEPKTENENSENDYDDILKSLQSLIDENDGSANVIERSENQIETQSIETVPKPRIGVSESNNSETSLNLNGSEIALADLKVIASGLNKNIRKLSPQNYVEMDELVILETSFKSTPIPTISDDSGSNECQKQRYIEMDSLFIMNDQKDVLTQKPEDLVPSNENPVEISIETLEKIRDILGIPEFDHSVINEEFSIKKSYVRSSDDSLMSENKGKKLFECDATISLECTEIFDPKIDLCETLGIPYVEHPMGFLNDVKRKSILDLKDEGIMKSSPLEAAVNNIGKENLDNALKTRDIRTKRKRIDYKQLAKGIRNDEEHSVKMLKRIKTVNNVKEASDTDADTKSLTQDMIANIIGVNVTMNTDDKLENIYLDIDPDTYKNMCKHRKRKLDAQCQKCTLRFTYDSCIKLLANSQKGGDKFIESESKGVPCNKLYKCGQCDYVCGRRDNLRTHFRKHTDERPYDCCMCDHKARTKDHLMRHQRTHDNLPKDDWRKSHREAQKMMSGGTAGTVPEEVFLDHSYAKH